MINTTKFKIIKIITAVVLFCLILLFSGCMSPQERNGVSLLPHNRPSGWESDRTMGGAMF
ncbi:MAG: hypothetical protein K9M56_06030 [Victivallales bacterium]|nr:hypothetical protein [Victivallales bacterium]